MGRYGYRCLRMCTTIVNTSLTWLYLYSLVCVSVDTLGRAVCDESRRSLGGEELLLLQGIPVGPSADEKSRKTTSKTWLETPCRLPLRACMLSALQAMGASAKKDDSAVGAVFPSLVPPPLLPSLKSVLARPMDNTKNALLIWSGSIDGSNAVRVTRRGGSSARNASSEATRSFNEMYCGFVRLRSTSSVGNAFPPRKFEEIRSSQCRTMHLASSPSFRKS
jgi:hypothetical protein